MMTLLPRSDLAIRLGNFGLICLQKSPIELGILKSFEFVSQLRRASVVVRQFGAPDGDIYVKGAPECMKDICCRETCKLQRIVWLVHTLSLFSQYLRTTTIFYHSIPIVGIA